MCAHRSKEQGPIIDGVGGNVSSRAQSEALDMQTFKQGMLRGMGMESGNVAGRADGQYRGVFCPACRDHPDGA